MPNPFDAREPCSLLGRDRNRKRNGQQPKLDKQTNRQPDNMRNNNPQPANEPSIEEIADAAAEAFASIIALKENCPEAMPSLFAKLPQPANPSAAHALLRLASIVKRFDYGKLARGAEFTAWIREGEDDDESEVHHERNGWVAHCLARHWVGDWGEVDDEDKQANEDALKHGTRLLSAYTHEPSGERIWIITEADRKVTTFLFPSEY